MNENQKPELTEQQARSTVEAEVIKKICEHIHSKEIAMDDMGHYFKCPDCGYEFMVETCDYLDMTTEENEDN